eukprot:CAMPEP_0119476592 /NCGR_PEP_ID=MMETSP1344-20130328/7048_1 /TAXON_ID=236787 /ORGANISM="Florenciella parvula, Strain CCMP2471" /LENGTH=82 /DNA_ID=CAMNT_0007510381 /DNA_START=237 /DNA_END=482 /DNA_ORIENTATION=-
MFDLWYDGMTDEGGGDGGDGAGGGNGGASVIADGGSGGARSGGAGDGSTDGRIARTSTRSEVPESAPVPPRLEVRYQARPGT